MVTIDIEVGIDGMVSVVGTPIGSIDGVVFMVETPIGSVDGVVVVVVGTPTGSVDGVVVVVEIPMGSKSSNELSTSSLKFLLSIIIKKDNTFDNELN
jgi:hypothetical protein